MPIYLRTLLHPHKKAHSTPSKLKHRLMKANLCICIYIYYQVYRIKMDCEDYTLARIVVRHHGITYMSVSHVNGYFRRWGQLVLSRSQLVAQEIEHPLAQLALGVLRLLLLLPPRSHSFHSWLGEILFVLKL